MNTHTHKVNAENQTYFLFAPSTLKMNFLQYKDVHCLFLPNSVKTKSHLENQLHLYCLLKPGKPKHTSSTDKNYLHVGCS